MNLVDQWPPMPRFDIVFLRNVVNFFDVDTKRLVLNRMSQILCGDGYLFLGTAETTANVHDGFQRMPYEQAGCYRIKR